MNTTEWASPQVYSFFLRHLVQGALEILIVSRLFEKVRPSHQEPASIRSPIPFNFTCLNEKWMEGGVAESGDLSVELLALAREQGGKAGQQLRGGDEPYPWGCNGGADWSCDFKFENILRHLGFIGVSGGFHRPLSSFSQGCANDFFPDFHVTSESATRPRLHVGFCSRPDEIQGTDFTYDGPLGGGNDYVRRQAVNGWMINHKSDINYYEMYTERNACRKSESFVQKCDEALVASMIRRKEKKVRPELPVSLCCFHFVNTIDFANISDHLMPERSIGLHDARLRLRCSGEAVLHRWRCAA